MARRRSGKNGGGGDDLFTDDLEEFGKQRRAARAQRIPLSANGWSRMALTGASVAAVPYSIYTTALFYPSLSWSSPRDLGQMVFVTAIAGFCLTNAFRDLAEARARAIQSRQAQRALLSLSPVAARRQRRDAGDANELNMPLVVHDCEIYAMVMLSLVFLGMFLLTALYFVPKLAPPTTSVASSHEVSVLLPAAALRFFAAPAWSQLQPKYVPRRPHEAS